MAGRHTKPSKRLHAGELAALRLAARTAYTLDPERITLQDLVCRPAFRDVGLARLRQWCHEEDWDGQRVRKADSWARRCEAEAPPARRARAEDWHLRSLQSLHDEALRLRCHPRVQPRSWESVAAFQLRVAQTLHEWRLAEQRARSQEPVEEPTRVRAPASEPMASVGSLPGGALEDLTDAEYQESAHHIMRRRLGLPEEEKEEVREPVKPRLVRNNG